MALALLIGDFFSLEIIIRGIKNIKNIYLFQKCKLALVTKCCQKSLNKKRAYKGKIWLSYFYKFFI
jgi:hypothetical protein